MEENRKTYSKKTRLFIQVERLIPKENINLNKEQTHYLHNVMRCKEGDNILIFNGKDGEFLSVINEISKKHCLLEIVKKTKEIEKIEDICLIFAPIKSGRIDFTVQKAVELGVSAIMPVKTKRTIVSRVNEHKIKANIIEAAEQSERTSIAKLILPYRPLDKVIEEWNTNSYTKGKKLIYCDETGQGEKIATLLENMLHNNDNNNNKGYAVLIGPEGGFSADELALLRAKEFAYAMSLGPRILRADTAALAALTAMQIFLGDW